VPRRRARVAEGETSAKINQDRGCVVCPFGETDLASGDPKGYKQALFCVFDGHGALGDKVSHFAMNEIQLQLEEHPDLHGDPAKALKEIFISVDAKLKADQSIDAELSGTTAVVLLYRQTDSAEKVEIWAACCGDSRAVLSQRDGDSKKWKTTDLTEDQKPDTPAEMARIKSKGGFISPPEEEWGGPARVWLDANMTLPGLAMARSIGDHLVSGIGVYAEPEVTKTEYSTKSFVKNGDPTYPTHVMVMASDGVWEFIESDKAVSLIGKYDHDATVAVTKLIETAAAKWRQEEGDYRDDITAIVVHMDKLFAAATPDAK